MKLTIKNLGILRDEVSITPAGLTIFSGGNNTGKTYLMYVLWALYQRRLRHSFAVAERLAEELKHQGTLVIPIRDFFSQHWATLEKGIADGLQKRLGELFSTAPVAFEKTHIRVSLDFPAFMAFAEQQNDFKRSISIGAASRLDMRLTPHEGEQTVALTVLDAGKLPTSLLAEIIASLLIELALEPEVASAFLLPAERGGLNLFYPDLDARNSALVRHLKRDESNPVDLLKDLMVAQYAEPIDAYIQFLKRAPRMAKNQGDFHDQALALQKDITRVRYKVSKDGVITAKPYRSHTELGLHLTSSTVKSFYGLWAWLELQARTGDCLMIDEPELNLHPDNQRLIARLLVRLVNRGIRVVISTHSDYIVRELNNMIMLASDFPERNQYENEYGYASDGSERLPSDFVAAYHFTDKGLDVATVDADFGIEIQSMDATINSLNQSNSSIYFALKDSRQPMMSPAQVNLD